MKVMSNFLILIIKLYKYFISLIFIQIVDIFLLAQNIL